MEVGAVMVRYYTESGSVYEVDEANKRIRQEKRSAACDSGRVAAEWRPYVTAEVRGDGRLWIIWGTGRDEHSNNALKIGEGDNITRATFTSKVAKREEVVVS